MLFFQEMSRMPSKEKHPHRQFFQWIPSNFAGEAVCGDIPLEHARAQDNRIKDAVSVQKHCWNDVRAAAVLLRKGASRSSSHSVWRARVRSEMRREPVQTQIKGTQQCLFSLPLEGWGVRGRCLVGGGGGGVSGRTSNHDVFIWKNPLPYSLNPPPPPNPSPMQPFRWHYLRQLTNLFPIAVPKGATGKKRALGFRCVVHLIYALQRVFSSRGAEGQANSCRNTPAGSAA